MIVSSWHTAANQEYNLVKVEDGNLDAAKEAFLVAFHHQYKKYDTVKDLGLKPLAAPSGDKEKDDHEVLEHFLQMGFAEEITRFEKILQNGQQDDGQTIEYFFQVEGPTSSPVALPENEENGKTVVGYAGIQYEPSKNRCYIHQLGVSPKHWGCGIGRKLVFALVESGCHPDLSSISLLTRRINQEGIDFYKHIGFQEVSLQATQDDYLDFTKYIQLEWEKEEKDAGVHRGLEAEPSSFTSGMMAIVVPLVFAIVVSTICKMRTSK
jgi:ribosomal protein S18 acetylase RimI-like enzyme|uniref:N-acetyltransferase domain-containing protein n=1 Tax=Attheya septentrionalis TaxID=420275 RepID=A0A6T7JSB4_9STRA|mmetsp:Transcript_6749/g.12152  ORF Transcript_6749/g.12152 Transcript_6749/m.12152 type:complete len:266 (-) Transcript_6749:306-1103(-)|eukprot:CAMPEP_0198283728 /NCGR_PEP_ID=MMETSP1449-20131203/3306_1 /TAXON_ID=420275 /ORGANISM="Attheya septentrionalis, Strain CCMP2084" /LENGTH=265 /DNA_ID=CAMNT_0043980501 /DNA_START=268 /DNA_END=1065 /DNA_ORIENTATION=+